MTDAESDDELRAIRERKLQELREAGGAAERDVGGGSDGVSGASAPDDEAGAGTPTDPIYVEGPDHYESLVDQFPVVLVDFYADWCGPCKMIEPLVEDLAAETDAAVLKVDIDAHQGLAQRHQVRGVPTLLVYADGEPSDRVVGVPEEHVLRSKIEAAT